ncbi:MAG: redoxin domain-containing protein, partial [Phormidesmis sp.]
MTLVPGDPAPDFSMPDADDNTISLSDLRGQRVV